MHRTSIGIVQSAGHVAGLMIIGIALITLLPEGASNLISTVGEFASIVGWPFLSVYGLLSVALMLTLLRIRSARRAGADEARTYWAHIGGQLCGLLSTIALVFTLWGLSQGVLLLGANQVTADTIDQLLSQLMTHFGVAFYSSIIGLPTAALGRVLVFVASSNTWKKENMHAISI